MTKEELIRLYFIENRSITSVCRYFHIHQRKFYQYMKLYNLKTRIHGCVIPWNKGIMLSEQHKSKIIHSCKTMNRGSKNPMYGVHLTPWNKNIRYSWSEEARERNKNSSTYFKCGKNNPNWKNGSSELNILIRQSETYKRWRKEIYKKDRYQCVKCSNKKHLEAHHKKEFSLLLAQYNIRNLREAILCKELWDIANGQILCKECHKILTKGFMQRDKQGRFTKVH